MSNLTDPLYYTTITTPEGDQHATVPLTPTSDKRDKNILGKPYIIPVLFIPGIMGTNLKKEGSDAIAWRPPDMDARGAVNAIGQLFEYLFKSTEQRVKELKTADAEVDPRGSISVGDSGLDEKLLRARRWGTVLRTSYHPVMAKLQFSLNQLSKFNPATCEPELQTWAAEDGQEAPTEWGAAQGEALTREEILHAANYQFDVWGGGYNWLQSNRDSGEAIRDYIEKVILPYYNEGKEVKVETTNNQPCRIQRFKPARPLAEQVIVVTHSMGGLVSRSLTEIHQCDKVLGVSHGVQPATGAPDTYKRMRAGAEGIEQLFLGRNAADLTAILTQAQGGMELLPTADYNDGKPWLRVRDKAVPEDQDTGVGLTLPINGDPYTDIYKSPEWYGMVPKENEGLMNPAGGQVLATENVDSLPEQDNPRKALRKLIDRVQEFHEAIQGKYKAPTYVHYGDQGLRGEKSKRGGILNTGLMADKNHYSYGQVVWEGRGGSLTPQDVVTLAEDDQNGEIRLSNGTRLSIAGPDAPGDGTVPWQSGVAPGNKPGVELIFGHGQSHSGRHNAEFGYDHQGNYHDPRALYATLYAIIKIAQNATWHKKESA
ncbi:lipase family alpha/beta hydrolase [Dechloromonas sp. A34]|uniref:lipase family alpha/beta hydrolase n=1 Tax=Dechloromonas sp. A34 TaxID=447588 RepID=UPI00224886C4|nr:hypothetical protein [Dechloromonas sp. A34]